jgi:hypothetical protein
MTFPIEIQGRESVRQYKRCRFGNDARNRFRGILESRETPRFTAPQKIAAGQKVIGIAGPDLGKYAMRICAHSAPTLAPGSSNRGQTT